MAASAKLLWQEMSRIVFLYYSLRTEMSAYMLTISLVKSHNYLGLILKVAKYSRREENFRVHVATSEHSAIARISKTKILFSH